MPGGFNLAGLLNNPQMVQMASQMVADPNIQGLMSQMMNSFMGPGGQPGGAGGPGAPPNFAGMEHLLRAGESVSSYNSWAHLKFALACASNGAGESRGGSGEDAYYSFHIYPHLATPPYVRDGP